MIIKGIVHPKMKIMSLITKCVIVINISPGKYIVNKYVNIKYSIFQSFDITNLSLLGKSSDYFIFKAAKLLASACKHCKCTVSQTVSESVACGWFVGRLSEAQTTRWTHVCVYFSVMCVYDLSDL